MLTLLYSRWCFLFLTVMAGRCCSLLTLFYLPCAPAKPMLSHRFCPIALPSRFYPPSVIFSICCWAVVGDPTDVCVFSGCSFFCIHFRVFMWLTVFFGSLCGIWCSVGPTYRLDTTLSGFGYIRLMYIYNALMYWMSYTAFWVLPDASPFRFFSRFNVSFGSTVHCDLMRSFRLPIRFTILLPAVSPCLPCWRAQTTGEGLIRTEVPTARTAVWRGGHLFGVLPFEVDLFGFLSSLFSFLVFWWFPWCFSVSCFLLLVLVKKQNPQVLYCQVLFLKEIYSNPKGNH